LPTIVKELKKLVSWQDTSFLWPTKEERKPPYTITDTKSRFVKKYKTTETALTIEMNKIIETENGIKGVINHAKEKGNYKKIDKIQIIVSNPWFHHDISTIVQSDVKAAEFMQHVAKRAFRHYTVHIYC